MRAINVTITKSYPILGLLGAVVLLLMVACGGAATPVAQKGEAGKPVAKEGAKGVPAVATPVPATVPVTRAEPTAKVVLATSDWGNELFTDHDVTGEGGFYQRFLHDYFIHAKEGKALAPGLAKSWSFTPDGLTWTFEVQEGIKFHDGTLLTAEDAAFSLEEHFGDRAEEKAVSPTVRAQARTFGPFRVTGPRTVSVTTTRPAMFLSFNLSEMSPDPSGVIFSKAYREKVGRDGYNRDPSPGATGPFELVRHDKGSLMRLQRFSDYWKINTRNHRFQTLELRLIPELSTRVAALRAGEVDLIEANLEVKDQIEAAGGKIIFAPEAVYLYMITEGCFLDTSVIPCTKGVRQALDYAIDKDLIAREIYGPGMAETKGWAFVSPSSLGYEPDLDSWPYDPAKARQLLAQAGCAGASCFPSPYILYTWAASELPFVPEVAQLVCSQWQKNLGIRCEVIVGDSTSIKNLLHGFKIPGNFAVRPNENRFDGGSIMYGQYGEEQSYVTRDPELQKLALKASSLIGTMEERHKAYHDVYVAAREAHYEWSLLTANTPWGAGPKIKSWQPAPLLAYASNLWTIELAR